MIHPRLPSPVQTVVHSIAIASPQIGTATSSRSIALAYSVDSAHFAINRSITRVMSECKSRYVWVHTLSGSVYSRQVGEMSVLTLCVLGCLALLVAGEVDECQVYYGGLIFPEGSRRSPEHGLHWSKTQSREREREVCWLLYYVFPQSPSQPQIGMEQLCSMESSRSWPSKISEVILLNSSYSVFSRMYTYCIHVYDFFNVLGKYLVFFFYPLDL